MNQTQIQYLMNLPYTDPGNAERLHVMIGEVRAANQSVGALERKALAGRNRRRASQRCRDCLS